MTGGGGLTGGLSRRFRLSGFRSGIFRFILPDEVFQLDAARVGRRFPGSGTGGLRQFFSQSQGAVPVLELAQQAGCVCIGLGPRILRCETAPLAALSAVMALTGNLQ